MFERAFGTEMEWGTRVALSNPDARDLPHGIGPQDYRPGSLVTADNSRGFLRRISDVYGPRVIPMIGDYTSRGSRLYTDFDKLETSTPEVHSLDELVACELADQRMMLKVLDAAVADSKHAMVGYELSRRCIDQQGNSAGAHESYQLLRKAIRPRDAQSHKESLSRRRLLVLGLHLATRGLYAGSGCIGQQGGSYSLVDGNTRVFGGRPAFAHSQKLTALTQLFHTQTTKLYKPLINTRDVSYASSNDKYTRIHVVSGDPTHSPWTTKIKVGTTRLILDAIEAGFMPQDIPQVTEEALLGFAIQAPYDLEGTSRLHAPDGNSISMLDIQWSLHAMAQDYLSASTLSSEQAWVMQEWSQALADIAVSPMLLKNRSDWAFRLSVLGNHAVKLGLPVAYTGKNGDIPIIPTAHDQMTIKDLTFDIVSKTEFKVPQLRTRFVERLWPKYGPPPELVAEREHTAPDGRPRRRGNLIAHYACQKTLAPDGYPLADTAASWGTFLRNQDPFDLGDPDDKRGLTPEMLAFMRKHPLGEHPRHLF